ncbi:MAG: hypothetical protein QXK30_02820 [Candidatus Bathyarchaeia archaeon]
MLEGTPEEAEKMKVLRVVFVGGESMEWSDTSGSVWAIDDKSRMIYIANSAAKMIVRIPFESIRLVEERTDR